MLTTLKRNIESDILDHKVRGVDSFVYSRRMSHFSFRYVGKKVSKIALILALVLIISVT